MTATAKSFPAVNGSLEIFSLLSIPDPPKHKHLPQLCPAPGCQGITRWRMGSTNTYGQMGSCQSSPRSTATPLCHLPPSEVTFSSASFLFKSIPAQLPGAQGQQSFIKASLSSPCFGDIVLWIPPSAQPLFKPSGKTLKIFILKNKSARSSSHRQRKQGTNYTP